MLMLMNVPTVCRSVRGIKFMQAAAVPDANLKCAEEQSHCFDRHNGLEQGFSPDSAIATREVLCHHFIRPIELALSI